jgi:hypothetical protein
VAESLTSRSTYSSKLGSHSAWWLVARHKDIQSEVLTVTYDGSEVLPVFSFREEAEMYILFELSGGDWQIMETGARELLSVLYGSCASVTLDPLPSTLTDEVVDLVSLERECFVSRVVNGGA